MINSRIAGFNEAFERLEPCAVKAACTVLRGADSSNVVGLPDFAFVVRQKRITTDAQDYYIDLVFYNYQLKCFLLVDLKLGKLTHQDVGQMDMYVQMYDGFCKCADDNPTIGLILCSEKNDAVAKYSMLNDSKQLFASKYLTYLPTEEELRIELQRERKHIMQEQDYEKL